MRLNSSAQETLIRNAQKSSHITRTYGKLRAAERAAKEVSLYEILMAAQLALEVNPSNPTRQQALTMAKEVVMEFDKVQANWANSILQAYWVSLGGKPFPSVFPCLK